MKPIVIDKEKRYKIEVGEPSAYNLYLIGCGGTGSFLALHLARMAYHAREQYGRRVNLVFVDPDIVEAKNIGRQNFCPAEIGMRKAETLARRYALAFGLEITFINEALDGDSSGPFSMRMRGDRYEGALGLVVGAVDNGAARAAIRRVMQYFQHEPVWWIDCGNHEHSGQVLIGNRESAAPMISKLGFCEGLPLPSVQHPELLETPAAQEAASCADLTLHDVQSLMVNQAVATYAASYCYRMVITHDLDIYATYLDLVTGSARSMGIKN